MDREAQQMSLVPPDYVLHVTDFFSTKQLKHQSLSGMRNEYIWHPGRWSTQCYIKWQTGKKNKPLNSLFHLLPSRKPELLKTNTQKTPPSQANKQSHYTHTYTKDSWHGNTAASPSLVKWPFYQRQEGEMQNRLSSGGEEPKHLLGTAFLKLKP